MKKMLKKVVAVLMLTMLVFAGTGVQAQQEQVKSEQKLLKSVKISLANKGAIYFGDKVTLKAVVKGKSRDCSYQWQKKVNGEWKDIAGETSKAFSFIVTPENQNTQYRVAVTAE